MKPSDYLKKGWCQGELAVDQNGRVTGFSHSDAVKWCYTGSAKAAFENDNDAYLDFIAATRRILIREQELPSGLEISQWNDLVGLTQSRVVKLAERVEKEMGL